TFNTTDLLYIIQFLKHHYQHYKSLEAAFFPPLHSVKRKIEAAFFPPLHPVERGLGGEVEQALIHFHNYFLSLEHSPSRTKKHISTPQKKSACKRLNMFLRWMVRKDNKGVDFGIWKKISPTQLICPIDVHVARVAKRLNLLQRKQADWQAALELTEHLKKFDANDPVKYDYALFGLGIIEKFY
ncbi:MAG: TIGR02757 family protein, partial [Parafilimonas sp.]